MSENMRLALIKLKYMALRHELINGNFTKVAKDYGLSVKALKEAYKNQ